MALTPQDARLATEKATGLGGANTAATRLTDLTKTDSPLMTQARTRGLQTANQRGMLNSSIAAGASEGAAIAAAQPLAMQDASVAEQSRQADLGRDQQTSLQEGQQGFQAAQSGLDRQQQTALQEGQIKFEGEQAGLNREQQTSLQQGQQGFQAAQAREDRTFTANQSAEDRRLEAQLQDDRQQFENRISKRNLTNSEAVAAGQMFSSAAQQRAAAQQAIFANPNMNAQQRLQALAYINDEYQAGVSYAESLFDVDADVGAQQRIIRQRRRDRRQNRQDAQNPQGNNRPDPQSPDPNPEIR